MKNLHLDLNPWQYFDKLKLYYKKEDDYNSFVNNKFYKFVEEFNDTGNFTDNIVKI